MATNQSAESLLLQYTEYSFLLPFEKSFDLQWSHDFVDRNFNMVYIVLGIYILMVFQGPKWMESRQPIRVGHFLFLWNAVLSMYSLCTVIRFTPEVLNSLRSHGLHYSVCNNSFYHHPVTGFWVFLFILSKYAELGDTLFLIIRKRTVPFLHWFHHVTVLFYCWWWYHAEISQSRWYIVVNSYVHSLMYTYFSISALGIKVPRFLALVITTLQILQMVFGLYISAYAHHAVWWGKKELPCHIPLGATTSALAMYLSYFVLFSAFFHKSYLANNNRKKKKLT